MNEQYVKIAKEIAKITVSVSVTYVIREVIKNNVSVESKSQKVKLVIATTVLGAIIVKSASDHVDNVFDGIVEAIDKLSGKKEEVSE